MEILSNYLELSQLHMFKNNYFYIFPHKTFKSSSINPQYVKLIPYPKITNILALTVGK